MVTAQDGNVTKLIQELHNMGMSDKAIANWIGSVSLSVFRWRHGEKASPIFARRVHRLHKMKREMDAS